MKQHTVLVVFFPQKPCDQLPWEWCRDPLQPPLCFSSQNCENTVTYKILPCIYCQRLTLIFTNPDVHLHKFSHMYTLLIVF